VTLVHLSRAPARNRNHNRIEHEHDYEHELLQKPADKIDIFNEASDFETQTHTHRKHQTASGISFQRFGESPGRAGLSATRLQPLLAKTLSGFVSARRAAR